jgi:predicted amidohydrolase YtcJ
MMTRGLLLLSLLSACSETTPGSTPRPEAAPVEPAMKARLLTNGHILTLDETAPELGGLRIEAGRITHVWAGAPPRDLDGERMDLGGAYVLPGLVDAHLHLQGLGEEARQVDLLAAVSLEETLDRVARGAKLHPAESWVRGRGWDQNDWANQVFPTAADLDRIVSGRPVWLERVDGHAVWVNSKAMQLAGIDEHTPSPKGGEILRDGAGRPSGIFVDNAIELVERVLPPPTAAELRLDLRRGMQRCAAVGLTGVHDMGVTPAILTELEALRAAGELPVRVTTYLSGTEAELAPRLATPPVRAGLLRVVGVKLFADGALGSRGAALLKPYSDRPETSGLLVVTPEELARRSRRVHAAGYQLAIHAIGDQGVRVALDAIGGAEDGDRSRHHRVEHAQVVAPEDVARFAALGAVASMQPTHATSDMPWAEARLGKVRLKGAYAWRSLMNAGAVLALGSDAPVESVSPWLGLYAAVTRQDLRGEPAAGFMPEERLSMRAALRGFTVGAAWAANDLDLGAIRVGARADLTIIDRNPETIPAGEILKTRVLWTVVDGRVLTPATSP